MPFRVAHGAFEVAEGVVGLVASRLIRQDGHDDSSGSEPAAWHPPAASSTSSPSEPRPPAAPPSSGAATAGGSARPQPATRRPARVNGNGGGTGTTGGATVDSPKRGDPPLESPQQGTGGEPGTDIGRSTVPTSPSVERTPPSPISDVVNAPPAEPAPAETPHVSEEPELVDEVADPGAEDGAGAQIRIAEPWEGYRSMKAADVIGRLASSSREELAAVQLYEMSARKRKSVLTAADRALKQASPPR